ncbi:MAG TPA: alpha/beta fold hydrolase [Nocardioidaceae bacterium]|nr:alpha/beta fold hydrolase [Nocardioidaceae bacterium]
MSDDGARPLHVPGLVLVEHEVTVPLDVTDPDGESITLFAREVADPEGRERPFLLFLQGGPGQEAPRPTRGPSSPGWLDRALVDYRVLMLDQRGTGRSSPVGVLAGLTPEQQAERLAHFRADAIVADAERLRRQLGVERWSVLGQSFGGFCALHYLSTAPESLREVLFTGGLPPVRTPIDDVYRATYATMLERNRRYYARYPQDRERVRALHERAAAGDLRLPGGDPVSSARLRSVGSALGMSDGAEQVHYLLERDPASPAFEHDLAAALPFSGRNPLYAVVHEASYADGGSTRWSAERMLPERFRNDDTLFTGEHLFRACVDEDSGLAPLRAAADLLAERQWPTLYDADTLRSVDVPCAAAVYAEDPYVDRALSEQTAALIPRMRTWVTNELEHNGLRTDGARVLDRLVGLARGRVA